MEKRKLGVLLSTPPSHPSVETAARLCEAAHTAQADVYLYLIDEGVKNLADTRFHTLARDGVKFFVCAYGCQKHGVPTDGLAPEVTLCGLVVLSNMINGCDRFLALT